MDGFDGLITPAHTDQIPALRAQRKQLLGLTADIQDVLRWLISLDASEFWSSRAQRAYCQQVREGANELRRVLYHLNEAQEQIWRNICLLEADR